MQIIAKTQCQLLHAADAWSNETATKATRYLLDVCTEMFAKVASDFLSEEDSLTAQANALQQIISQQFEIRVQHLQKELPAAHPLKRQLETLQQRVANSSAGQQWQQGSLELAQLERLLSQLHNMRYSLSDNARNLLYDLRGFVQLPDTVPASWQQVVGVIS